MRLGIVESHDPRFSSSTRFDTESQVGSSLEDAVSQNIERFAERADEYCNWLQSRPEGAERQLSELRILLVDLQAAVLRLPEGFDGEAPNPKGRNLEAWKALVAELRQLPFDHYREVFDPFSDEEPVDGSLADDLADIFFNLQEGLELYNAGYEIGAAWHWRHMYWYHWGEHLTGAQRAVHWWFARCEQND